MKKLIKLVVVLLLLLVVLLVAAFFYIDTIAKTAIEKGSTYALGVPTTLKSADIRVFSGQFVMAGLDVSNPQGFATPHFLTLGKGNVEVKLNTLTKKVIKLPLLKLNSIDLNLEKKDGKSNYQVILDNLKKSEGEPAPPGPGPAPEPKPGPPAPQEEGTRYIINKLTIKDIMVHVDTGMAITKIDVPIDEIKLKGLGSESDNGLLLKDLAGVIVKAVFEAVVREGGSAIPAEILGDLKGGLAQLGSLEKFADVDDLGKTVETIGDKLKEDSGNAIKDLGGLLGGEKKK